MKPASPYTESSKNRDRPTSRAGHRQALPCQREVDEIAAELLDEFAICTDLILDHRDGTLARRPVVAHSPIKSPRLGF